MTVLVNLWGYDLTVVEFVAVILAITAISLSVKGTRWAWPPYFISALLYGYLFVVSDLYASAAMQLIFTSAAVWGWFTWGKEGVAHPTYVGGRRWLMIAIAGIVAYAGIVTLLHAIGGHAAFGDALMLLGSLVGQLLMVWEKVDAWFVWIVVNVVGTILYFTQDLYFTSLLYAVLLFLAIAGLREWSRRTEPMGASAEIPA